MKRLTSVFSVAMLTTLGALLLTCTEENTIVNPAPPAIDHIAPEIGWLSPEPNAELSGDATLTFTAADSGGIARIALYRNGLSPADWQITPHTDSLYTLAWNTTTVDDGLYILEVRAWDAAGNAGVSPALLVRVKNTPTPPPDDHTPPDVWWESPEGGATLRDTVTLRVRVFDESGVDSVALYLDGEFRSAGVPAGNGYEYLWDTRADSDGVHLLSAVAWDSVGNAGVSPALLVKVQNNPQPPAEDHTPPVIVWLSPEPGDTVEGTVDLRFNVLDDDRVDSVKVYLNGRMFQTFANSDTLFNYEVQWATNETEDGNYIFQVKAWDRSLNVGLSEVVWFQVWNNRPRVIWVPDEYETIQAAINASTDGDTVRVRAGLYEEGVRIAKPLWLESESGPEVTIIDATGHGFGCFWAGIRDTVSSAIRGFTIRNCGLDGIFLGEGASVRVLNNVISQCDRAGIYIYDGMVYAAIVNNIIVDSYDGLNLYITTANISNNIIFNIETFAIWNSFTYDNPVIPDYNMFWSYQELSNNPPIHLGGNNILDQEPLFEEGSFRLQPGSPGINQGNPALNDTDGTRSDIGVYGGPNAYR